MYITTQPGTYVKYPSTPTAYCQLAYRVAARPAATVTQWCLHHTIANLDAGTSRYQARLGHQQCLRGCRPAATDGPQGAVDMAMR